VDKHLLVQVDGLVHPVQGPFHGLQVRGVLVHHRQVMDVEARGVLDLVQVAELAAEVDDGADALGADGIQLVVGHGRVASGQVVGDPVELVHD
jgi:hypothetical protein